MSEGDAHDKRINSALAIAAHKRGYQLESITTDTPLDWLIRAEEGDQDIHDEALTKVLLYFYADGPHPGCVLRRVFAVAKAIRPDLLLNMTDAEIGQMFDETRAAQSWRRDKIFSNYQKERGVKGFKSPSQKSEGSRDAFSDAQRGNTNRRGKTGRKKAA